VGDSADRLSRSARGSDPRVQDRSRGRGARYRCRDRSGAPQPSRDQAQDGVRQDHRVGADDRFRWFRGPRRTDGPDQCGVWFVACQAL
jgi:hypothetical protein